MPISLPTPPELLALEPRRTWTWELRIAQEPIATAYTSPGDYPPWPRWITVPGSHPETTTHLIALEGDPPP